ncbi:MAG: PHP domain-containing protein [Clostridiaceae bacterium]
MTTIDLHMHSSISIDGEFTPTHLMEMCHEKGLKTVSLTDHNSTRGVEEAMDASIKLGMSLIAGIELDCSYKGVNLHLLGYGIDFHDTRFSAYEKNVLDQEMKSSKERIQLIRNLGIVFSDEDIERLSPDGVVTGEIIAEAALLEEMNRTNPLIKPYFPGGERSDNPMVNFYWDFCAMGKPAYVHITYMSLEDAVALVENTGGIPFFAHPGNNIGMDEELLKGIIKVGVKGIEVYSSYHSAKQTAFFENKVNEMNLLFSSGSDFHGKTKPSIHLGGTESAGNEDQIRKWLHSLNK